MTTSMRKKFVFTLKILQFETLKKENTISQCKKASE